MARSKLMVEESMRLLGSEDRAWGLRDTLLDPGGLPFISDILGTLEELQRCVSALHARPD